MTETAFNLVDEPWVRVLQPDGTAAEVSLRDVLLRAHTFADLGGELPTQNIAVLRLLLAVLHTVFSRMDETGAQAPLEEPDDAIERWVSLWSCGALPEEPIVQYLEQWHERFWLFHPTRPFGQSQTAQQGTQCSAAKLIGEVSESGNKLRLFPSRTGEGKTGISYAEAARWLLYLNGFDDAALKPHIPKEQREGKIALAWLGQLGFVYAKGSNLFETLLLNLVLLQPDHSLWGENCPAWERETPRSEELRVIPLPDNQAELLTLQSRLIWLNREGETVTGYGHLEQWLAQAAYWLPYVQKDKPHRLIERWEQERGATEALDQLRHTAVFHKDFHSLWINLTLGEEQDVHRAAGKGWESGAVRLMTLHGSKGLEFPAVILAGVKQGALPLESSTRPADIEEERRLFYVGMTRAREELILTTTREPSVFVDELPDSVSREKDARRKTPAAEQLTLF